MSTTTGLVLPRRRSRADAARRAVTRSALVLLGIGAVCLLSLWIGSRTVGLPVVWDAVTGNGDGDALTAIVQARVPRTVVGLLAGGALGLAGAVMQGLTRNPLADPGILGVNAGAAFAMVVAISWFGVSTLSGYVWFALAGAAVAAVLVHGIAGLGRARSSPFTLVVVGAAFTAGVTSWTAGVLLQDRQTMDVYRYWQVGTIGGRGFDQVATLLPFLTVGAVVALGSARRLNTLALGDELARGLGRRVGRDRLLLGAAIVLLCGGATALAGPIAFVGLVVPHAVRAVVGPDHRRVLPLSALAGAVLVLVADVVGRVVLPPTEVQVGIMTAVVGVPAFVWVVRRRGAVSL